MQEDNPISRHREREMSLVAAGLDFPRIAKDRSHARVRHIRLQGNVRFRDGLPRRINQPKVHYSRPDPNGLRRDFVLDLDCAWRIRWSGAGGHEHSGSADAQQKISPLSQTRANPLPPESGECDLANPHALMLSNQVACTACLWSHAQEQTIVLSSASDGNMW